MLPKPGIGDGDTEGGPVGRTYVKNQATEANHFKVCMAVSASDTLEFRTRNFPRHGEGCFIKKTSPKKRASKP